MYSELELELERLPVPVSVPFELHNCNSACSEKRSSLSIALSFRTISNCPPVEMPVLKHIASLIVDVCPNEAGFEVGPYHLALNYSKKEPGGHVHGCPTIIFFPLETQSSKPRTAGRALNPGSIASVSWAEPKLTLNWYEGRDGAPISGGEVSDAALRIVSLSCTADPARGSTIACILSALHGYWNIDEATGMVRQPQGSEGEDGAAARAQQEDEEDEESANALRPAPGVAPRIGRYSWTDGRVAEIIAAADALCRVIHLASNSKLARGNMSKQAFTEWRLRELVASFACQMAARTGHPMPGLNGATFLPDGTCQFASSKRGGGAPGSGCDEGAAADGKTLESADGKTLPPPAPVTVRNNSSSRTAMRLVAEQPPLPIVSMTAVAASETVSSAEDSNGASAFGANEAAPLSPAGTPAAGEESYPSAASPPEAAQAMAPAGFSTQDDAAPPSTPHPLLTSPAAAAFEGGGGSSSGSAPSPASTSAGSAGFSPRGRGRGSAAGSTRASVYGLSPRSTGHHIISGGGGNGGNSDGSRSPSNGRVPCAGPLQQQSGYSTVSASARQATGSGGRNYHPSQEMPLTQLQQQRRRFLSSSSPQPRSAYPSAYQYRDSIYNGVSATDAAAVYADGGAFPPSVPPVDRSPTGSAHFAASVIHFEPRPQTAASASAFVHRAGYNTDLVDSRPPSLPPPAPVAMMPLAAAAPAPTAISPAAQPVMLGQQQQPVVMTMLVTTPHGPALVQVPAQQRQAQAAGQALPVAGSSDIAAGGSYALQPGLIQQQQSQMQLQQQQLQTQIMYSYMLQGHQYGFSSPSGQQPPGLMHGASALEASSYSGIMATGGSGVSAEPYVASAGSSNNNNAGSGGNGGMVVMMQPLQFLVPQQAASQHASS